MKSTPRLLPLVAVAIGGVLALKALTGVQALPDLLASANARAEEAPAKAGRKPASLPKPTSAAPASGPAPVVQSRAAAPVCAQSPTELAKEAGLSPGELQTLQNLGSRRGQLDDRERALDTQLQLLAAAEAKVDGKMKSLNALKGQIQGLLGQASQQQQTEVDRLVNVYQKMKPRDAAAVMATLDDKVRVPVAAKMKDAALAAILSQMPTAEAKKLTESLAHRFTPQLSQADPASAPAQAPAQAATQVASAAPSDGVSAPEAGPAAEKPAARKPHVASRSPAHKAAVAHAKRDTPTVAAAKAVASPVAPAGPGAPSKVQTAANPTAAAPGAKSVTPPPQPKPAPAPG